MTKPSREYPEKIGPISRRRLLEAAVATSVGLNLSTAIAKQNDPRKLPPKIGDDIVYPSWENDGQAIRVDDIKYSAAPTLAYPRDPDTQIAKEKSRLNQILLVRFSDEEFDDDTRALTINGIVAYSGVCTHTGCSVTEWDDESKNFLCPCHASQFDPRRNAKIIGGPALRPLPLLTLGLDGEFLKIAAPFNAKVGAKRKK